MGKKATKTEINDRILETAKLIGEGKPRFQIVDILCDLYNISIPQADRYIGMVYQSIRDNYADAAELLLSRYDDLYQKAVLENDKLLAKQIQDSIAKITVLKDKKIDVDITTAGQPISVIKIIEVVKDNDGTNA